MAHEPRTQAPGKLRGLSLFSGIGGLDLGLSEWVVPVGYSEKDLYAQAVLRSRIRAGDLPPAPIWPDVTELSGAKLRGSIDLLFGGFPCQDISIAGLGAGLAGKRSGLFYELLRLADETKVPFVFLESEIHP